MMPIGLSDKLYWRFVRGTAHCFKRERREHEWTSLCHRAFVIPRSFGGSMYRPPVTMRCGGCDAAEMERRKKDESLDPSADWKIIDVSGAVRQGDA